jgi:hypothetical protein
VTTRANPRANPRANAPDNRYHPSSDASGVPSQGHAQKAMTDPPAASLPVDPARRAWPVLYILSVALAVGVFAVASWAYRRWIDRYQRSRPRYAAERAIEALGRGDLAAARRETALLLAERPVAVAPGQPLDRQFDAVIENDFPRDRVMTYEQLTARLLQAGLQAEAEAMAYKTILEYHVVSRPLELPSSWSLLLRAELARRDGGAAFQCAKILAAHGIYYLGTLDQILEAFPAFAVLKPLAGESQLPVDFMTALNDCHVATLPEEWNGVAEQLARVEPKMQEAAMRRGTRVLRLRALVNAGRADQVHRLLAGIDPADPAAMDLLWLDRPSTGTLSLAAFVDRFRADPRARVDDLGALRAFPTGYFDLRHDLARRPGQEGVLFDQSVGARLDLTLDRPTSGLFLAYSATTALGVAPILLLRVDDRPVTPVYCDAAGPAIEAIDLKLAPGAHRLELLFLNDATFLWPPQGIQERRSVRLHRLALTADPPRG